MRQIARLIASVWREKTAEKSASERASQGPTIKLKALPNERINWNFNVTSSVGLAHFTF